MKAAREVWFDQFADVPISDLVFIDEFGASTSMTRLYGRAPKGERVVDKVPGGRWSIVSTIAALTSRGIVASASFVGATDSSLFLTFVREALVPVLRPGQIVILDNLSAHKLPGVRELIEPANCRLILLPPYSPDLNPIEQAISKIKTLLRSEGKREIDALIKAIARATAQVTPQDAMGFIGDSGYVATGRCKSL